MNNFLYILPLLPLLSSCVNYDAQPFTGHTLPRITGYTTGVTNDWLYINLRTGRTYNATAPCSDIPEGAQRDSSEIALDWDIAFCGYRLRTNSGTSGIGQGGAADLGYDNYDTWTSASQVAHLSFTPDNDSTISTTISQNDWNKYLLANNLDFNSHPWFDPNTGPITTLTSANPILASAISFSAPPATYTPSFHTYCIRSADASHFFKLLIVSWYDEQVTIGGQGGKISFYLDQLD